MFFLELITKKNIIKNCNILRNTEFKESRYTSGGLTWGQKGRLPPPDFFPLPYFENLTPVKISSHRFTHYLLWDLKNLPPLNFKLSPPLITPYRTVPNRTEPKRQFSKIPLHLNVTFFTHRDMQRYIEKFAIRSIVALNCNGKDHRYTYQDRYYRYRTLKNIALRATLQESLQFWSRVTRTVIVFYKLYQHRYK